MLRFLARRWAKIQYIFHTETEAANNDLNAKLALHTANEKRQLVRLLTSQADEMDARIKELDTKLEVGFLECENGHEASGAIPANGCPECSKPMKLIKRDQMSGQEKYESDKERGEAEKIAQQKRDEAKAEEENIANSERTAAYLRKMAENGRALAIKIRNL